VDAVLSSLANTIAATFIVSLVSLTGIFALSLKEGTLHRILFVLIALSAGSILGAAYLDRLLFLGKIRLLVSWSLS